MRAHNSQAERAAETRASSCGVWLFTLERPMPSTYDYLWVAGHLERDRDETQRLHNEWSEASIHSCKIKINAQALYKWLEWCKLKAEILNFSEYKIRKKFLDGLPHQCKHFAAPERVKGDTGTWVIPANYPGHHPLRNQPNPSAGRPDAGSPTVTRARHVRAAILRKVVRGITVVCCDS